MLVMAMVVRAMRLYFLIKKHPEKAMPAKTPQRDPVVTAQTAQPALHKCVLQAFLSPPCPGEDAELACAGCSQMPTS
jgi:hypothetical protein